MMKSVPPAVAGGCSNALTWLGPPHRTHPLPRVVLTSLRRLRILLTLVPFQSIVERLGRSNDRRFVGDSDRQDGDSFIVGQHQRPRAGRQIDRVCEQIRVSVSFVAAVDGMTMRSEPCGVCALNKTRSDLNHF